MSADTQTHIDDAVRFTIDPARVVSETLENETIVINFQNGMYYSLNASATAVWRAIQQGLCARDIAADFCARYDGASEEMNAQVRALLAQLEKQQLITRNGEGSATPIEASLQEKVPYVAPELKAHEDMQEMLLADPIHDIDASGWPNLKAA